MLKKLSIDVDIEQIIAISSYRYDTGLVLYCTYTKSPGNLRRAIIFLSLRNNLPFKLKLTHRLELRDQLLLGPLLLLAPDRHRAGDHQLVVVRVRHVQVVHQNDVRVLQRIKEV